MRGGARACGDVAMRGGAGRCGDVGGMGAARECGVWGLWRVGGGVRGKCERGFQGEMEPLTSSTPSCIRGLNGEKGQYSR